VAMLLPMILFVALLAYAVSKGIELSLRPINSLRDAISKRNPQDLRPLEVENMPEEIRPLLAEMNRLMADLDALHESSHRFLANATHQLRTPLAALRAQAELALRSAQEPASREALQGLLPTLDRQAHLVQQLLSLSRAENAPGTASREVFDLTQLAREVTSDWVPRSLEMGLDIVFDAPEGTVRVYADRNGMIEALSNLLDNATRYSMRGGVITVAVSRDGNKACLTVRDTGQGVPPDQQEKIFDRFYRIPGTQGEGCGLGLAIVRQIVRSHGGEAEARNRPDGSGFEVCIRLPLDEGGGRQTVD
jgi:two-component system sensor histidine kinase TctE